MPFVLSTWNIVTCILCMDFNIRNTLPKSGTFLLGHPVYTYIYIYILEHCTVYVHKSMYNRHKRPLHAQCLQSRY